MIGIKLARKQICKLEKTTITLTYGVKEALVIVSPRDACELGLRERLGKLFASLDVLDLDLDPVRTRITERECKPLAIFREGCGRHCSRAIDAQ